MFLTALVNLFPDFFRLLNKKLIFYLTKVHTNSSIHAEGGYIITAL